MKYKFFMPYLISTLALCGFSTNNTANASQENGSTQDNAHARLAYATHPAIDITYLMPQDTVLRPTNAIPRARDVLYIFENGDTLARKEGSRAWRNNNPGNLRYGKFSVENGAIGECGKFAVFPDEETGMNALCNLLVSDSYKNLTIRAAIAKYAPPSQNNVSLYVRKLCRQTSLSPNTKLGQLSPEQLLCVANAIRKIEGWKVGSENIHKSEYATLTRDQITNIHQLQDSLIMKNNMRTL